MNFDTKRVLIIEDDRQSQVLISQLLKKGGYQVCGIAANGAEGLSLIRSIPVDVILLDLGLPDMDGIDLLFQIQKIRPLPVIVLSANEQPETVLAASEAGAVFYLVKPPDLRQLDRAIIVAVTSFSHKMELIKINEQLANEIIRRNSAEQRVLAGDIRYRELFELLRDGVVLLDLDGSIIQYNSAFIKMIGYFPDQLNKIKFVDIIFENDIVLFQKIFQDQVLKSGWSETFEIRFLCKSGDVITVEQRAWLKCDTPQSPLGVWVYIHDITKRKQADSLLRESERTFRALTENTPDIIIRFDTSGRILYVNPAFEKYSGINKEFVIGKKFRELDGFETDFCYDDPSLIEKIKSSVVFQTEISVNSVKGQLIFDCRLVAEFDDEGNLKSILSTTRDITDLKQTQQNLVQFEKMQAVDQLAGGIAHDFNNQLGAIMGYSDLLLDAVAADAKLTKYVEAIMSASKRATDLTMKLKTFARKGKIKNVEVDLHDIIHEITIILEHSIAKNLKIETLLEAKNHLISGDPSQIQNAILNLSINARDAMEDDGLITFRTENVIIEQQHSICKTFEVTPGPFLKVSVRDTGCGMDTEILKHLFEPFFTTKPPGKGTGLGLAAVYGTVKSHHGGISLNSIPGEGTVFELYFPILENIVNFASEKSTKIINSKTSATILLIDDEDLLREMASEGLMNAGYKIIACSTGGEALSIYKSRYREIDLIIIDIIMPGLNGHELFGELKKINAAARAVFASGCLNDSDGSLCSDGIVSILHKPFRVGDLLEKISEALRV